VSRLIWRDGRFTWWFVGFVVLFAALWLATDIAWRVIVLPFETFLISAVALDALLLLGYLAVWHRACRKLRRLPRWAVAGPEHTPEDP
jgi:hypothetical protein